MFDRFSDDAIKVVSLAQDESRRLRHGYIDTAHILLGLTYLYEIAVLFTYERAQLGDIRVRVEELMPKGEGFMPAVPAFSGKARELFQLAEAERGKRDQPLVNSGHLLVALVEQNDEIPAKVFSKLGIQPLRLEGRASDLALELRPRIRLQQLTDVEALTGGAAAIVLQNLKVDTDALRAKTLELIQKRDRQKD